MVSQSVYRLKRIFGGLPAKIDLGKSRRHGFETRTANHARRGRSPRQFILTSVLFLMMFVGLEELEAVPRKMNVFPSVTLKSEVLVKEIAWR